MKCNSCNFEIRDKEKHIACGECGKEIHSSCAILEDGKAICDLCYMKIAEEILKPKLELKVPEVIRRSYIQTYQDCPFKFYNEVILGHKQPENIYAKIGIDLHDLFDKANMDKSYTKEMMTKDMMNLIEEYPDDIYVEALDKQGSIERTLPSIEHYYHVTKDMVEPFTSEQTIQFSVGDNLPLVQATSDRINKIDGELHVMDWKTGSVMSGVKLSTDLQAPLYIHSIREKYKTNVKTFTFFYLKDNKRRVYEQINDDRYACTVGKREYIISIPDAIKTVQQSFSKILQGQFNIPVNTKGMYYHCKMCHIKKLGLCEGAEMQVWNQFNK